MKQVIIETERLYLRQFTMADVDHLHELDSDPEVMRYIGDGVVRDLRQVTKILETLIEKYREDRSFGVWAACTKGDDNFIGWGALKDLDQTELIEVGYRLLRKEWGKGYATEIAKALLEYGFDKLKLKRIVAITHKDNIASQKVISKSGLIYINEQFYYKTQVLFFEILAEEYSKLKATSS
ncbi:MAG: GNAT family N-acetyltransferase [Bacteroidia bacterium]|nr:GNAT family N-acetyltransferase [Bacteroidia bacterium]